MSTRPLPGPSGTPQLTPGRAKRLAVFGFIVLALLGVLLLRLWFLQVLGGADYEARATDNRVRTVSTEPPRGVITDRKGRKLVMNRAGENVVVRPQELPEAHRERVLRQLARALETTPALLRATLDEAAMQNRSALEPVILAEDVDPLVQAYIEERRRQLPGVSLDRTYVREYPYGSVAAHILGYTQPIPAEEEKEYRRRGYRPDERVGRAGVELQYEEYLRGTAGETVYEVDAAGELTGRGIISAKVPRPGRNVQLTIDLDVQRALDNELRARVALSSSRAAAGVALDPSTGEVLALASYPTFNPAIFGDGGRAAQRARARINTDGERPLFNRAIAGGYPAASTFKIVTAIAGLETGHLKEDELIGSPSFLELYGQKFANYGDAFHGNLTARPALMYSSDTFFYSVASRFWEDKDQPRALQQWAERFGFGARTGIDLAGEAAGIVPTPEYKEAAFPNDPLERQWLPGDIIQMAIGQKLLQVTPLQLAVAYGAVANAKGEVPVPSVVRKIEEVDGSTALEPSRGRRPRSLGAKPENLDVVRDGLYMVTNEFDGTASGVFQQLPDGAKAAGKTGTAEVPPRPDHSLFAGYAPFDDPKIVVAIVVENGGTGANAAAPGVCNVMAAYLKFDANSCGSGARPN